MSAVRDIPALLAELAGDAYMLGLSTIGEAVTNRTLHYDLYWIIGSTTAQDTAQFEQDTQPYWDDAIEKHLTHADKVRMDALMEALDDAPLLINIADVCSITGLDRVSVLTLEAEGSFPSRLAHIDGVLWRKADVELWNAEQSVGTNRS